MENKTTIKFKDAAGNIFTLDIEITHRNGYPEFSICGTGAGSAGQCEDSIKPLTDAQARLLAIWREWHLNGTHAGTVEQEAYVKANKAERGPNEDHYTYACRVLKAAGLYEVEYQGKPYQYGAGWTRRELPDGFWADVLAIVKTITEEENERAGREVDGLPDKKKARGASLTRSKNVADILKDEKKTGAAVAVIENSLNVDAEEAEKILALAAVLDLTLKEALEDISGADTFYSYGGNDYIVATDEEADQLQDEEFDQYLDDCLLPELPETAQKYFDRDAWKNDAKDDGRGHSLNRYDGNEESATVNKTEYFIYQQ